MKFSLCADDFAQNKEISEGILKLAYQKRLSAISCMTSMPLWPDVAADMGELKKKHPLIEAGIHFNLTHGVEPFIQSLAFWIKTSALAKINKPLILDAFNQQCDAFEDALNQVPDFIDGHQHVHAFPQIREIIIEALIKRYGHSMPWVRNLCFIEKQQRSIKTFVLQYLTRGLTPLLINNQIPHNRYFGGLYDLKPQTDFKKLLSTWLKDMPEGMLIMCHPGLASSDKSDPIANARIKEFEVLASSWFDDYAQGLEL